MSTSDLQKLGVISVVFENRADGGLRVYSDDVPGFVLSHHDAQAVYDDVKPALETIIGHMMKMRVSVTPLGSDRRLPWFTEEDRETREYEARAAA